MFTVGMHGCRSWGRRKWKEYELPPAGLQTGLLMSVGALLTGLFAALADSGTSSC